MSEDHRNDPNVSGLPNGTQPERNHVEGNISPAAEAPVQDGGGSSAQPGGSRRPADYYASPRTAPRFPRWIPLTCGVAAILVIVLMVGVGAFLRSGGLAKLVALSFGQVNAEAGTMFAADVDEASRTAFSKALLGVRDAIADGKVDLSAALPLLQEMQKAIGDRRLSREEVDELTALFEGALAPASDPGHAEPAADTPPVVDL